jgi:hypothetical protein
VLLRFVRTQAGVEAAEDDSDPPGAEAVGDLVGAARLVGPHGERHQIPGLVVGDRVEAVVHGLDHDVRRRESGEDGEGLGLHTGSR